MLRSMYAGISGMKNFQTKLDVIGNNISNVNTSGFKKGRVTFQDMMSQMTSGAQGATINPDGNPMRGGVNPAQVGLGSQLGSIDNIHTQGFRQSTNNPLDFALEGDGMFVVASDLEPGNLEDSNVSYTRAGNFYLDEEGSIVNAEGMYLMGFPEITGTETVANLAEGETVITQIDGETTVTVGGADVPIDSTTVDGNGTVTITADNGDEYTIETAADGTITVTGPSDQSTATESIVRTGEMDTGVTNPINIPDTAQSFSVQSNGTVNYIDENGNNQVAGQVVVANFSNPAGLQKAGSNLFLNSENAGYNGLAVPETDGVASIVSGSLEMSNVDLAEEFTEMITAQRSFQANTRIITTSDEILQELVNLKR
ncbi:flagellar hook-basal body complex protein [Virgibacillus byunsanensis]|uniref:Flagellar hook protein FlgE n=1 Tax=Virgibacillus byunsanensis TaxID=570945 RepID=A0ABW3LHW1_9BACI